MLPVMNSLRLRAGLPSQQQPVQQPVLQPPVQPLPVTGGQPPTETVAMNPGQQPINGAPNGMPNGMPSPMNPVAPINSIRQRVMPPMSPMTPPNMPVAAPPNLVRPAQGMMQNALRARAYGSY